MRTFDVIKANQKRWAEKRGISLHQEYPFYTKDINQNLFVPLSKETTFDFSVGNGGEIDSKDDTLPKMQALFSSSALVVNVFEYWMQNKEFTQIANALGIENKNIRDVVFEQKFPVINPAAPAHIDVCFNYGDGNIIGIECKFTEPYTSGNKNQFSDSYFRNDAIWNGICDLRGTAQLIKNGEAEFNYLDAGQLVKHIVGLNKKLKDKSKYKLLYMYYPAVGTEPENAHEIELMGFEKMVGLSGIQFKFISWREVISYLFEHFCGEHEKYVRYIMDRYVTEMDENYVG